MPARLGSISRKGPQQRGSSRPPVHKQHSSFPTPASHPVLLEDLSNEEENAQEWEPEADGAPLIELDEIKQQIKQWEDELRAKGREVSGRTIVVVHALPYVATLHPVKTSDAHAAAEQLLAPRTTDASRSSTPLEILPGDPLLRPRGLHSPTRSQEDKEEAFQFSADDVAANGTSSSLSSSAFSDSSSAIADGDAHMPEFEGRPRRYSRPSFSGGSSELRVPKPLAPFTSMTPAVPIATPTTGAATPRMQSTVQSPSAGSSTSYFGSHPPPSRPQTPANALSGAFTPFTHSASYGHHAVPQANGAHHQPSRDSESPQHQQATRWTLHPRRGHAALNSGLRSLSDRGLAVVGRPDDLLRKGGEALTQDDLKEGEKRDLEVGLESMGSVKGGHGGGITCVPVWLEEKVHSDFYDLMCKTMLWPTMHYHALPDNIEKRRENQAWEAYYHANLTYAKKVAEVWKPGDLIWVHDYHLLLVPKMLRELLPNEKLYISLFLHCPFPSSEYFRCLPRREALLDGMLGCNLVCFQAHSYARHFLSSCVRVMGYEAGMGGVDAKGTITKIGHCPIGIDVDIVEKDRHAPGVAPKAESLRRLYPGKKIIVGRDKLDPTKGVLPKLRAFERFLSTYPEWAHKVVLIQVTSPSPGDSSQLATKVSELVDHINAVHGTLHFQPVHHYHQTIERDEYFALLTAADCALITSTRDGMNTTSMEYILCQAEHKGTIIVSEYTGVAASLKAALKINPWDIGGVATAIKTALEMPMAERIQRHAQLHERVMSQTAAVWAAANIACLLESLQGEQATRDTPKLDVNVLQDKYKKAKKRLLLFDYDGTLTPIVKNPVDAVPPPGLIDSIKTISEDPKNIVYIISGRDGDFLDQHFGSLKNVGMSAEHGCFLRAPGEDGWLCLTDDLQMDWKRDVVEIFKYYQARTQGSSVEKKLASVTFHYRNSDPIFGAFQAKECQAMLESMQESLPIDVIVGKKNVEVRPAHTNKGDIVHRLLYLYPETEFVLCVGDDKTDEDMFHTIATIANSVSAGEKPVVDVPESLNLFPSLVGGATEEQQLEPVQSQIEQESVFTVAVDTNSKRMTLANYLLPDPSAVNAALKDLAALH